MTESRLLSQIVITAGVNDALRVTVDPDGTPVAHDLTISPGTYYMSDDGSALPDGDFVTELKTQMDTIAGRTWVIDIHGIGVTSASVGSGRIQFKQSGVDKCDLEFTDTAATTLDPRILGGSRAADLEITAASIAVPSPYVHRMGWYPQIDAAQDQVFRELMGKFTKTTNKTPRGTIWGSYDRIALLFDGIPLALARLDAAVDYAARLNLTDGDPNCAWEMFCQDLAFGGGESGVSVEGDPLLWRYYPDITDSATFDGPFSFPVGSSLWTKPLGPPSTFDPAGEYWDIRAEGESTLTALPR